ncbi:MAG: hypothetical protein MJ182_02795 [Treponema sp.]|nr:hypothetical protein [Treponema sp.]
MKFTDIEEASIKFLRNRLEPFTAEDFRKFLKSYKMKLSVEEVEDILYAADWIFSLKGGYFISRAGAFTNQWFSFKPTKEEVEAGAFVPGHRFIPFIDASIFPYQATVVFEERPVPVTSIDISSNLALDLHAYFGEGYDIPYILNDPANSAVSISSVQYGLPSFMTLTAFSLQPFVEKGFQLGDRLLCRVTNWDLSIIEARIVKNTRTGFKMSREDLEREEWYEHFEEALVTRMDRWGPMGSIEDQLSLLFLEEQRTLCTENCGSIEDFLEHTSKIDIVNFGVESRIWKSGETIPYKGPWNEAELKENPIPSIKYMFTDYIIDSYIKDNLFKNGADANVDEITARLLPPNLQMGSFEKKFIMLNLEKRIDIVKNDYNRFNDFPVADLRRKILNLFFTISSLLLDIGYCNCQMEDFPQHELIVLVQIFEHVARYLSQIEESPSAAADEKNDILASLDGMLETYDSVAPPLQAVIKKNKKFEIKLP